MKKLTKLQRHTAYCIILAEIERREKEDLSTVGLCHLLKEMGWKCEINKLPELRKRKPKPKDMYSDLYGRTGFWDKPSVWDKRKQWLRECIEETY